MIVMIFKSLVFSDNFECVGHQFSEDSEDVEGLMEDGPFNNVAASTNIDAVVLWAVGDDALNYNDSTE